MREEQKLNLNGYLSTSAGSTAPVEYSPEGIPLYASQFCSDEGRRQAEHYDRVAQDYLSNLTYPHTQAYMDYLNDSLLEVIGDAPLGVVAEICCGHGEALGLLSDRIEFGIGVDVSLSMLRSASRHLRPPHFGFVQADATMLPIRDSSLDSVLMFGGIHHVNDRAKLFAEVHRVLKPNGRFIFREPVSDFFLWKFLRDIVYRLSPALDHETERPLRYRETVPYLENAGLKLEYWRTFGFFGFCIFMNSDILIFNRLFRFIPGISRLVRAVARLDEWVVRSLGPRTLGLQVIGIAVKR